jgi:hypothetical protein
MREEPPLDLDTPRHVDELFATTLRLFGRHSGLFLSLALLVVAPFVILVNGVWARGLTSGASPHPAASAATAAATVGGFVVPVLVTALHVAAVRELGAGRVPTVGDALRSAGPRFPTAIGVVLFYTLIVFAGLALLVVPGVWLAVGGYFGAQIAVTQGTGPFDAVMRSVELVRGRWWQTAGRLVVGQLALVVAFVPLGVALTAIHAGLPYIVLLTVARAVSLSLSALYGTLLYFSLLARKQQEQAQEQQPVAVA